MEEYYQKKLNIAINGLIILTEQLAAAGHSDLRDFALGIEQALNNLENEKQNPVKTNWNGCRCNEWGQQGECVKCGEHYTDQFGKLLEVLDGK
jgi:hypothetical protein